MTDSTSLIEFSEATPNTTNVYPITDLTLPNRSIYIITTAAMPWMTGTAVNPLLRALYLCAMVHPSSRVTLVIPWLFRSQDRLKLYSPLEFLSKEEQEDWIRHEFCVKHCQDIMESTDKLHIQFYNAIYKEAFGSIFSIENIPSSLELLTKNTCNVAILEEPEHLNWIRVSYPTWKHFFRYVIGIVHTNYPAYAANAAPYVQWISEHTMTALCAHVVRANCHLVLSLSGVIPQYMKTQDQQLTCNVHGVRQEFFQNTHDNNTNNNNNNNNNETPIYYIGKLLWAKGFDLLLAIQDEYYRHTGGHYFSIDIYGGGSDSREIQLAFLGTKDERSHPNEQPQPPQPPQQEKSILNDKSTPFTIWNQPSSLRQCVLEHQVVPYTFFDSSSSSSDNANTPYAPWTALPDAAKGTLHTSVESTMAIYHLTNRVVQHVLHHPSTITTIQQDRPLPLPAKFLGVKNHVLLKSMHYKIFLNPSISEG